MQPLGLGRVGLGLAAFVLAVAGVVVATEGTTFPGVAPRPTVVLAPAAIAGCAAAGPYRPPERDAIGLPAGLDLCPSGPLTIRVPGAVVDGVDVRGGVVVAAPDVVVRRSRITGDGTLPYGVRTAPGGSVRIEDTTITGDFPVAAIGDDRWTGERVEIVRVSHDGARLGSRATLRNSLLHGFAPAPGDDATALRLLGARGDALVEGNRVEMGTGPGHRSAVLLAPPPPDAAGRAVVIRDNVLGGGEYTLHQAAPARGVVEVLRNRFRRDAAQAPLQVSPETLLEGNTFVDGGPVAPP